MTLTKEVLLEQLKAASKDIAEGRLTRFTSGKAMLSELAKRRKKK